MMKKLLLGLGALIVVLAGFVLKTLADAGQFKQLAPHFAGRCTPVPGMPGAEDITFHPTLGHAYVSSDDRRATQTGRPVAGGIYRYDPTGSAPPVLLTSAFSRDFHPHGLSLFVAPDGTETLYVINHTETGTNQIERFEVGADGMLVHRRTLRDAALVSPNDLVAVDAERFYVTNDHGSPPGTGQAMEDYLQLARGNVLYFDGERFREVIRGTAYANGINRSADGLTVYLAQSVGRSLSVYTRDVASGALTERRKLPLDTGPDNIELDARGHLWVGSHPKLLGFAAHAQDVSGKTHAPAQVLRLKPSGDSLEVEEVFLDDGKQISGVAVAAVSGNRMLLGPVFDKDLLSCEVP
ncbi:SMP-30/gluconolactonase/LRE family protein [Myxococcus sp. RHSTA-1-4]|uniref:SMP-30/gluconolactonase/LRE family protein n=1 Tax=Myxococcus sp. RHSTA-1-4 TaxID=2874601 RepID=UPI001CC12FF4|nr:SMP-30/gluconolactonase/LRE family protein [Myxococcus sp. RHSTA-1-4]MBZ4416130.1 SMP-30/gluconolactonase/LRE family protein [Myxococcus sp. RHSTA-1-4]